MPETQPIRVRDLVVETTLGSGGMATVYLARQEGTGAQVALKLMHPHLAKSDLFVKRFLREIAASAQLAHENIVRVVASGEDAGRYFIASEYVDGGSLEQLLLESGRPPFAVAAELGRQLLAGLAYAHAQGLVHRDVKPANLLLTRDGLLKIADFGIAKSEAATTLTATGGVLGTPAYMSPEQAAGKPVDLRCDLFSAGVVLYEMLSGSNPFIAETPAATMVRILRFNPPPLFECAPEVPATLAQLAEHLLQRDPLQRPASAAEIATQLEAWLAGEVVRGRAALASYLKDPKTTLARTRTYFAQRAVKKARELLAGDAATRLRAALEAFRALQLAPEEPAVQALAKEIEALNVQFGPPRNPKISELEATLADNPDVVGVHTQLASLYRLEGNLFKAVVHLKRAVRLRPNDGYLVGQLATLTGESLGSIPAKRTELYAIPAPAAAAEEELHTGQTGVIPPRQPTGVIPAPVELLPTPLRPPPRHPALEYALALWNAGGKYVVVTLAVVLGLIWGVRKFNRGIDYATLEEKKVHDVAIKYADAKARALVSPALAQQDEAMLRRMGDPDYDRAVELAAGGHHDEAADAFGAFISKNPERTAAVPLAQFQRGRELLLANKPEAAATELLSFASRNPEHESAPEARVLYAEALVAAHRFELALEAASKAIVETDTSPLALRARIARAKAALEQGARADALRDATFVKEHASATQPIYRTAVELLAACGVAPDPSGERERFE